MELRIRPGSNKPVNAGTREIQVSDRERELLVARRIDCAVVVFDRETKSRRARYRRVIRVRAGRRVERT